MVFYDFEVFEHDWLVVILDVTNKEEHIIVNDKDKLQKIYERYGTDIWVGFNSRHYDQYIFKGILAGFDPKKINDFIIIEGQPGWKFSNLLRKFPLYNFDIMQRIDRGLKTFEGFMGNSIKESSVPFDIDRKLTKKEIEETIKYCRHDVEQTIEVFLRRKEEFDTVMFFINHFGLSLSNISKTKPQLASIILEGNGKGHQFDDEFEFPILSCLDIKKYKHIADWYRDPENHNYSKSQKVVVAGLPHTFAWGGLHSEHAEPINEKGIFLMIDVTAYYPSQQAKYKFGYRVMNAPENFEFIHNSNIEFKKKGDKKARLPFKIMDNAISGQMKQKSSKLYDPMGNNSICVNGQLLLLDLIEHLEGHCRLIQSNTDGLLIKLDKYEDFDLIDDIVYEWEQRTNMEMGVDTFIGELFQKDVNNYLIVDRETGEVKSKGGYTKKLSDLDYDLPIVNKAVVDYMIHKKPVEKTITECNELKEFQQVKKITSKYLYLLYGSKKLNEKCVRCFASTDETAGGLTKIHATTNRPAKVEGTPEHVFLFNDEVNGVSVPKKLDKQWYINVAKKRLRDYGKEL